MIPQEGKKKSKFLTINQMKASDSKHLLLLRLPIQTLLLSSRVPLLLVVVVVWLVRLPPAAAAMTPTRSKNAKTVKKEEETTPAQEPKPITHNKSNKQTNKQTNDAAALLPTYLPTLLRNYYLPKGRSVGSKLLSFSFNK
jgi:hypothetical protein